MAANGSLRRARSLLEEAATAENQLRKVRRRATLDEQVHKKIMDNFKDYDKATVDSLVVEGMTLRERLTEDTKQSQVDKTFTMGANYYKKLKDLYRPNASPLTQLKVKDTKLAVCDRLMKAMVAAKASSPNRGPMVDYLNSAGGMPNQTEVVGICRCACELKPSITTTQLPVALDICKFMAKHDFKKNFPEEMRIMLPWVDATLVQAYIHVKKSALRLNSFIELHSNVLGLVMDMALVDKLLKAQGSWLDVSEALNSVVASSKVGHKMFSFACEHVLAAEVSKLVDKQVDEIKVP